MKYTDYRTQAQSGDLVLCSGAGKMSKAIIASAKRNGKKPCIIDADNVYYSHIGVVVVVYGHVFICEAIGEGIVLRRFSEAYKEYKGRIHIYRKKWINTGIEGYECFVSNMLSLEGWKYDYKSILDQLLAEIKILKLKHHEDKALYCSEAVNLAANYYWGGEDKWVTPHDIAYTEWKAGNFLCELKDIK